MLKNLIFLAILIFPIATSFRLNLSDVDARSELNQRTGNQSPEISTKNFTIYKRLGNGACGVVYLVKKNGGSDDGKLYAMKSQNILNYLQLGLKNTYKYLNGERKILEEIRELPWSVSLHYAWREANWLFLVMDVATGGTVDYRLNKTIPDATSAQRILSETVVAFETIHNLGIIKGDFKYTDVLVDSDGHILLGDFGFGQYASDSEEGQNDWRNLVFAADDVILPLLSNRTDIEKNFVKFIASMTDDKIPELKNHPYFNGVDWEKVAEKKADAPFEPTDFQIDDEVPLDPATLFKGNIDEEYENFLAEKFPEYFYSAPEHQN